jgi:hypothetical protein
MGKVSPVGAKGGNHLFLSDFATIVNLFRQASPAALTATKMYPIVWSIHVGLGNYGSRCGSPA